MFSSLVSFFTVILLVSESTKAKDDHIVDDFREVYTYYCSGENDSLGKSIPSLSKKYPDVFESYVFNDYLRDNSDAVIDKILSSPPPFDGESEVERLRYALALINSYPRSDDFVQTVEKLTDFNSQNPSFEANRRWLRAFVDSINGNITRAEESMIEVIGQISVLDSSLSSRYLWFTEGDKGFARKAAKALRINSQKAIDPEFLRVVIHFLESDLQERTALISSLEKVYDRCSRDPVLAESYATELIFGGYFVEAHPILQRLIAETKYPSPYVEYLYAISNFYNGNLDLAEKYLRKSIGPNSFYLHPGEKEDAKTLLKEVQESRSPNHYERISLIFALFLVALFVFFSLVRPKMKRNSPSDE